MKNNYTLIETSQFKDRAKNKEDLEGYFLRKQCTDEIEKDPSTGAITFTISDETVDRDRDIISLNGWELDNFKNNPVVLFAHNSRDLPIARAVSTFKRDKKLKSKAEFTPRDLNPLGDTVRRMVEDRFLRATSVGMLPKEWEFADNEEDENRKFGINFLKQELLEWSIVPIPANPSALIDAHAAGIDTGPIKEWAEKMLELDRSGKSLKGLSISDLEKAWTVSNRIFTNARSFFDIKSNSTISDNFIVTHRINDEELKWYDALNSDDRVLLAKLVDHEGWQNSVKDFLACTHPVDEISVRRTSGGWLAVCESCDEDIEEFTTFQELEAALFSKTSNTKPASTTKETEDNDPEIDIEDDLAGEDLKSVLGSVVSEELARNFGRLPD